MLLPLQGKLGAAPLLKSMRVVLALLVFSLLLCAFCRLVLVLAARSGHRRGPGDAVARGLTARPRAAHGQAPLMRVYVLFPLVFGLNRPRNRCLVLAL